MARFIEAILVLAAAVAFSPVAGGDDPGEIPRMPERASIRYFMANAWANWIETPETMQEFVDAWTSRGLNGCGIQVPWREIEPEPGRFVWKWLDERLAIIGEAGLKVHLRLSTHSHRPGWVDADLMRDPAGDIVGTDHWSMLSFSDPRTSLYVSRALQAMVRHVAERYGTIAESPVACVLAQFSGPAETEYAHDRWSDFSQPAQTRFRAWVQQRHSSIEQLNARWAARYASWDQVTLQDAHPYDFQTFRSATLAALLKRCAAAVHTVPGAAFCVQFGSIWDGISVLRGTRDARALIEHADWVVVDDYPLYNHAFSMDYLRGHARDKVWGNEIDGPGIVSDERGLEQCTTSLARGARVLWAANWPAKNIADADRWTFWEKVMKELRGPAPTVQPRRAIVLSLATLYRQEPGQGADGLFMGLYNRLTNDSREAIDILTDTVVLEHPDWVAGYSEGLFLPASQAWMTDALFEALRNAGVPVHAEDEGVGRFDEYGRVRRMEGAAWKTDVPDTRPQQPE